MNNGGARPPRVRSVQELCSFWDEAFVERVYWSVLGREPDPSGRANFLHQLRNGASKLDIIDGLRNSDEGLAYDHGVEGLDETLARHRKTKRSLLAPLMSLLGKHEGNGAAARKQRANANHREVLYAQDTGREQDQKLWQQVRSRLTGLAELSDRQEQVESTLAGVERTVEQVNRRLIRIEAALKRIEEGGKRASSRPSPVGATSGEKSPRPAAK